MFLNMNAGIEREHTCTPRGASACFTCKNARRRGALGKINSELAGSEDPPERASRGCFACARAHSRCTGTTQLGVLFCGEEPFSEEQARASCARTTQTRF